jgi:hypothetical protein
VPAEDAETFWLKLIRSIKERKIIPIIGPELLQIEINGKQVLLYDYLAEYIAQRAAYTDALPAENALSHVAAAVGRSDAKAHLGDFIENELATDSFPIPTSLLKLAAIEPLQLFVTTTLDSLMERALNQVRYGGSRRTTALRYAPDLEGGTEDLPTPDRPVGDVPPTVFHLFGSACPRPDGTVGKYVITESDVLDFLIDLQGSKDRTPANLFTRLSSNDLLLIGNGFHDWLARFFVRITRGPINPDRDTVTYFADDTVNRDDRLKQFFRIFSRKHTSIFEGGCGIDFVNELARRWEEQKPKKTTTGPLPVSRAPENPMHGTIFISYERNDKRAAQNAAERLQSQNLRFFFDETNLRAGMAWEKKIQTCIQQSAIFLPLVSRAMQGKPKGVVFQEWEMALEVSKRWNAATAFIVPVLIDEDTPKPELFRHLHCENQINGELTPEFVAWLREIQLQNTSRLPASPPAA